MGGTIVAWCTPASPRSDLTTSPINGVFSVATGRYGISASSWLQRCPYVKNTGRIHCRSDKERRFFLAGESGERRYEAKRCRESKTDSRDALIAATAAGSPIESCPR